MGVTVAIDPGVQWCGVAVFADGALVSASLEKPEKVRSSWAPVDRLTIEVPQVYRAGLGKGDPNDLIAVAVEVGRLIESAWTDDVERVRPHDWKGSVPKEIHNARTLAVLSPAERACLPKLPKTKMHNVLDAVGLGLWSLEKRNERSHT